MGWGNVNLSNAKKRCGNCVSSTDKLSADFRFQKHFIHWMPTHFMKPFFECVEEICYWIMLLRTLTSQGFKRVQNQLARLVTKSPPLTRTLPLLRSLHWLPARFRISFKTSLLTYKTLREKQSVYLHSMPAASLSSCSLRSNSDNSLSVPRVKTNTGARAFHSCAPSLLNNLPLSVHSAISFLTFKKYLKTHHFDMALAFPP